MKKSILSLSAFAVSIMPLLTQPVITVQPTNQVVVVQASSTNVIFSVVASGAGPFNYLWTLNGTNLPNNIITRFAGTGSTGYSGDGGAATNARLSQPQAIAKDSIGNIFVADSYNQRIRKIDVNGIITTIAGTGINGTNGDGGAATSAKISYPNGIAVDKIGNVVFGEIYQPPTYSRIRKISTNGIITTIVGSGLSGFSGDGGPATNAKINLSSLDICGMCFDASDNLLFADYGNGRIRMVDTNGYISTIANAGIGTPKNVAVDNRGNIYVGTATKIYMISSNSVITTFAGGGASTVDGSLATNSQITAYGLVADSDGNVFIGDTTTGRRGIRKVDTNGIMTTIAGVGGLANTGDGGPATNAAMGSIYGLLFDNNQNLIVLDDAFHVVRKINYSGFPTISFPKLSPTAQGNYQVIVTSPSGSVTSSVASLSFLYPPISEMFIATNTGRFTIGWPAFQPSVFQVQWSTNLSSGTWSNLGGTVPYSASTNGTMRRSDSDWTNYLQRFYRFIWVQ